MKKQNPVRILTSQVMKSPSARETLMRIMARGRKDGWTRSQYVTGIRDQVVAVLAKKIYRDIDGPNPFTEDVITKAGARIFRQLVTVEAQDVRGLSPIMEPWAVSPTPAANEARMREVGMLKAHRDERRRAFEARAATEAYRGKTGEWYAAQKQRGVVEDIRKKSEVFFDEKRRRDQVQQHAEVIRAAARRSNEMRAQGLRARALQAAEADERAAEKEKTKTKRPARTKPKA
jgi:hypothetical protein